MATQPSALDHGFRVGGAHVARDVVAITVVGAIDMLVASSVRRALSRADEDGAATVLADLSPTTFIDSLTLGVLLGAARGIERRGRELRIACEDANITRIFELTLLGRLLDIYPSRAAALQLRPGNP